MKEKSTDQTLSLTVSKEIPETSDLQELTKGCNSSIVSYSLECFSDEHMKTRKIVVFFSDGFCCETINKDINNMMIRHNQSLVKSQLYKNNSGSWKRSFFKFAAYLLRPILGVKPSSDLVDITNVANNYNNGRGLSW